ncbi:MAG: D-aminoacyl-tRNA deacylase, partial [Bdellovibrionales bacterium]|nr:D-aminoacyl-tRNA deacylase [Bdellovibrionales bacterium]
MRMLIQRVKRASVEVDGGLVGRIDQGLLALLAIEKNDDQIKADNPASAVIVIADDLEVLHVDKLINELNVFSILKPGDNITENIKKAIEDFKDKNVYFSNIQKVKTQNEHLQTLTENLEKLVSERTKKEFEANQKTVTSLKGIQSILKFIKAISRVESVEEIMNEVRREFKRFHGLMPPILVFLESSSQIRVYFFQGKQFVEKISVFDPKERPFADSDQNTIRSDLSNLFGRPFGTVSVTDMGFSSQEMGSMKALIVCEHSFNGQKKNDFEQYSFERWPVINMALENVLLKQKSHEIAKQWSKTFNEMKDPIVILDWQYKMTLSNSIFHKTIQEDYLPILEQKDQSHMNHSIQQTFDSGESQTADIHLGGKVYRVHSYPIRLIGEDKVSHVINQYVDVTQSID